MSHKTQLLNPQKNVVLKDVSI